MLKRLAVFGSLLVFSLAAWWAFVKIFIYGLKFVLTAETYYLACVCFVAFAVGCLGVVAFAVLSWLR
jgi:hypothetical protein